jgi:hypothetical protein
VSNAFMSVVSPLGSTNVIGDTINVDFSNAGSYNITFSATDSAGYAVSCPYVWTIYCDDDSQCPA